MDYKNMMMFCIQNHPGHYYEFIDTLTFLIKKGKFKYNPVLTNFDFLF